MARRTATIAVGLLLFAGTTVVLRSGLNGPPRLWILEYGFPGSQRPTGRAAVVEGVEFVEISPGCARIGSDLTADPGDLVGRLTASAGTTLGTPPRPSPEMAVHWAGFRRGFWIARHEVTNEQYERLFPRPPNHRLSRGDRDPALALNLAEIEQYCDGLSERSGLPVRLPSEAEWECACRAGTRTKFACGDDGGVLREFAWFGEEPGAAKHEVKTRKPNAWGLFDLHGNVQEWCRDDYLPTYRDAPSDGSARTGSGATFRVYRGGENWLEAWRCRSATRGSAHPATNVFGFRPAFSLGPDENHRVEPWLVEDG